MILAPSDSLRDPSNHNWTGLLVQSRIEEEGNSGMEQGRGQTFEDAYFGLPKQVSSDSFL